MASRLIIDGNSVYEIDEDCEKNKQNRNYSQQRNNRRNYSQPQRMNVEKKGGNPPL